MSWGGGHVRRIACVAQREFLAAVATKTFVFGLLIAPAIMVAAVTVIPWLISDDSPAVTGELAVIDRTGEVVDGVRAYLDPHAIAERRGLQVRQALESVPLPDRMQGLLDDAAASAVGDEAAQRVLGDVPRIAVVPLPVGTTDVEDAKQALIDTAEEGRLALVVVHHDAVVRDAREDAYGSYDFFVRARLDTRVRDAFRAALRAAIVDARVRRQGLDRSEIEALTRVRRLPSITVTQDRERETSQAFDRLLPVGFMGLLLASVMIGGQSLLTTTIEEKASRVVEVMLSAVSPMELMTGKILGQMCVGFVVLGLYSALGMWGLFSFALLGLVDPSLVFYLLLFFVITYLIMGSFMAAAGAAVNELREAQTLMTPFMLIMSSPWFLWFAIARDPNSWFSIVTSFLPPINLFAMLLRMTSSSPPPWWQVWLSIAVGVATVMGALWCAAKVFRIGLLLHGKPPNFATLVRWVRMA